MDNHGDTAAGMVKTGTSPRSISITILEAEPKPAMGMSLGLERDCGYVPERDPIARLSRVIKEARIVPRALPPSFEYDGVKREKKPRWRDSSPTSCFRMGVC